MDLKSMDYVVLQMDSIDLLTPSIEPSYFRRYSVSKLANQLHGISQPSEDRSEINGLCIPPKGLIEHCNDDEAALELVKQRAKKQIEYEEAEYVGKTEAIGAKKSRLLTT